MDSVIETKNGPVHGTIEKSHEGFFIYTFKGIPYAEPPIGELRFADPVPIKNWVGIKDVTKYGPACMQRDPLSKLESCSEDCLYLNVYVKSKIEPNSRKAVMVWIHGGAFIFGSSDDTFYGPDYLVMHDVILVTINYRLGVLGFLNLEDEFASGNQGLKDQAMGLRWVHENIANFGGDPGNITIFGESAGGASVHHLCMSPLSKDYVHKAISQSGVALNSWALVNNQKKHAIDLCKLLGKTLTESKDILKFLRTINVETLFKAQTNLMMTTNDLIFAPSIDSKSTNPFMPIAVEEALKKGIHIPYLVGYTSREGIFVLQELKMKDAFKLADQDFNVAISFYNSKKLMDKYQLNLEQLRRLHFKSKKISVDEPEPFVDLLSDTVFNDGIHKALEVQIEHSSSPTYFYQLSYDSVSSFIKVGIDRKISGVSHFDDIRLIFKGSIYEKMGIHLKKGTKDYRVMEQMTTLWTNFAKYGKPTVTTSELIPVHWQPVNDKTVLRYLDIDEDLTMKSMLNVSLKYLSAKSIVT